MIISKKLKKNSLVEKFFKFFNKIIYFLGIVAISIIILFSIYYYLSGFKYSNPPKILFNKINDKILINYLGIDLKKIDDYSKVIILNFFGKFQKSNLDKVYIEINQKSILGLEMQREIRKENGGEIPQDLIQTYPAKIKYNDKIYKIKIRTKGVRNIHWLNKNKTSYKIDLIGEDRIWGLEEFAFQKPIARNYTYEYLFHKLLGHVGLTNIKYFFINLYLNDQNHGVYAVEESFSKELIERQKLRNGPIFGISEELGEYYPNVRYELYSDNYWINEFPIMIPKLFSILNDLKNNNAHVNDHFDLEKWAKYFAIMDITGTYHGSLVKSVKKYYNPTTGLFEPIGYDLHKGAGNFENFVLLDFLQESKSSCEYLCAHKDWYLKFFLDKDGKLNYPFLNLYIKYLKEYSNKDFIDNFLKKNNKELKKYNKAIYKDGSKTDKISRVGLGYFIFDEKYILSRINLLKNRINSANLETISISKENNILTFEDYSSNFPFKGESLSCNTENESENFYFSGNMKIKLKSSCNKIKIEDHNGNEKIYDLNSNILLSTNKNIDLKKNFKNLKNNLSVQNISENNFLIDKDLTIKENTILNKFDKFTITTGKKINILNNSTLFIEGDIFFENNQKFPNLIYSGDETGSVIFSRNKFKLKNLIFANLSAPKLNNLILYGGVNFIDTDLELENVTIRNSKNEDGLNIINSKSKLLNLKFENIFADALDIDFGNSNFKNISCYNIKNDCLDVSGVNVIGENLYIFKSEDKGVSVGENSNVEINNINIIENKIGIAVKDGSSGVLSDVKFQNNNYDVAIFNKKKEFDLPNLLLKNVKNLNISKILQSENTNLIINDKKFKGNYKDKQINTIIY